MEKRVNIFSLSQVVNEYASHSFAQHVNKTTSSILCSKQWNLPIPLSCAFFFLAPDSKNKEEEKGGDEGEKKEEEEGEEKKLLQDKYLQTLHITYRPSHLAKITLEKIMNIEKKDQNILGNV